MIGLVGACARWDAVVSATLTLLGGLAVVLVIDLRRRAGELADSMRRAVDRDRALSGALTRLEREVSGDGDGALLGALDRHISELRDRIEQPIDRALGVGGQIEQMERRVFASFEAERLRAEDRHRELEDDLNALDAGLAATRVDLATFGKSVSDVRAAVAAAESTLTRSTRRAVTDLTSVARDETQQVEALLQLLPGHSRRRALMPPSGQWALDARSLAHLLDIVRVNGPRMVVELGSGTSSIWLGYALQQTGGKLVTVDHTENYGELTRAAVKRHGLDDTVEVLIAPIVSSGEGAPWYDRGVLSGLRGIDLLLVDGPPKAVAERVRQPALPYFADRLEANALVLLDDAHRPDESAIADEWADHYDLERIDVGVSRLAVLRKRP